MKKLFIVASAVCLFASCKKDQLSSSEPDNTNTQEARVKEITVSEPSSIIGEDCNYVKLTQTAPNVWEAYFGLGSLVKFSDLHIRNDGRVYGKIISAGTNNVTSGYPILSGNDDYRRDFSFQQTTCSGSEVTKEEVTLTYQQYLASTNGQTTFSTVNGSPYNASQILTAAAGGLNAYISGLINGSIVFKRLGYSWTSVSCTGSYLTLGKLTAKNVVQQQDGSFTVGEYGIAPMCYADQMPMFYAD